MEIRKILSEDLEDVNRILLDHFFSREPLGIALGLQSPKDFEKWVSEVTKPILKQNVSWIAEIDGKIAGILLNKIAYENPEHNIPSFEDALTNDPEHHFWKLLKLMNLLYKDVDLMKMYKVNQIFIMHILVVDPAFSKRGIGKQLIAKGEQCAKEMNFGLISCETTGFVSAKLFRDLGYKQIKELEYQTLTDESFNKINSTIHKSAIIWTKEIA